MGLGCFPLKTKKKHGSVSMKRLDFEESKPIALPEPPKILPSRNLQSAPPSFRTRVKPIHSNNNGTGDMSNRARVMSAPSSIHGAAERDFLSGVNHDEQDEQPRGPRTSTTKESSPQPLPLPSPRTSSSSLKNWGSFKSFNSNSGRLSASGPLPLPPSVSVRSFSYDEVVSACSAFSSEQCVFEGLSSVMYMASFGDEVSTSGLKKVDATVVRLHVTTQSTREFINEVNTLVSLQHQNLCKLLGYHAHADTRMLVYERLAHGSLDRLLHGRSNGPPLDWNTRMKIALCAAQGLTFLHEEGPFHAMYNEFSTANIQVDKDFSAKLSGYGFAGHAPDTETSNSSALANLSVETLERGLLTPKSNVWSYSIVLLEILTGRKNMDGSYPNEERNLVKWSRAFLADDCRLSLIMDPQLKGRFPAKAARNIADIAQKCLHVEPSERPTMRNIVDQLKIIQDMKYSCRFPLREPTLVSVGARKHMGRSSSLNTIIWTPGAVPPRSSFSPSPPPRRPSVSPVFPPRACSSLEVMAREEVRRSSLASGRRASLEGF